jgi:bifunctional UDP-N-acetylglucosamine pyrophosphorylase / glucosamine-1-phosphate N-acetyltransferase
MVALNPNQVASVIFAAGKGSRMIGYEGNKTLLPLVPKGSLYLGERPLLVEVLENLPSGPKGIVVNHCAEDVKRATEDMDASYHLQPVTNGTGGALLAAKSFLEAVSQESVVITMGDVPLIRPSTYEELIRRLDENALVVLASNPKDRGQYGMLEMEGDRVLRIVEWKYWRDFSAERQSGLRYCNAGVYAAKRTVLLEYMAKLAAQPHHVQKQRGDQWVTVEEYFLTDLVELMGANGLPVGVVEASEQEVVGVDTPEALRRVQDHYATISGRESATLRH